MVSEANNHGEDCGRAGLKESLSIARVRHYPVIGIGTNAARAFAPYRVTINGQRIAIIAATQVIDSALRKSWTATARQPGLASAYRQRELIAAVRAARKDSDTVVVYLHWGTQTQECPNPIQEPLARALVRAGADIVAVTRTLTCSLALAQTAQLHRSVAAASVYSLRGTRIHHCTVMPLRE